MKKKVDIDEQVAVDLGMKKATVALVTAAFLNSIVHALVEDGEVRLESFGRFLLQKAERTATTNLRKKGAGDERFNTTTNLLRVWFKKSPVFKEYVWIIHGKPNQEDLMDKHGVDEGAQDQEALEKKAAEGCPQCGAKLERHGKVLICPVHGSEPFEHEGKR